MTPGPGLDGLRARLTPAPRVVDWSLLALATGALATGVVSLGTGHPSGSLLFVGHGALGVSLAAVLAVKLRRVRRRVTDRRAWDRATPVSVLTAVVVVAALASGTAWALGASLDLWGWTLLNLHIGLGLVAVPLVLVHLRARYRPLRRRDLSRRDAVRYAGLLLAGAVVVRSESVLSRALDTPAARARFTGSRPTDGDSFPVTSWVADDPDPVETSAWRLRVEGLVERPLAVPYADLDPDRTERALLDCTSGWYTEQDWRGVRVGDLLADAGVTDEARWVTVWSVTGYRWSFPLREARAMLLATHVGGEPLSHGHGAPVRLVAPDRRGFQWVKWVRRIEVRRRRDASQYVATLVSGL